MAQPGELRPVEVTVIREGIWPADLPKLLSPTAAGSEGWSKTHAYTLPPRRPPPAHSSPSPPSANY
ncbi:hypothetical protein [Streptomyces sp. NPDC054849]